MKGMMADRGYTFQKDGVTSETDLCRLSLFTLSLHKKRCTWKSSTTTHFTPLHKVLALTHGKTIVRATTVMVVTRERCS